MSISAFLPVFDEEKRISHALTSLQWCNEIILLDKYSTDKTVEIAKQFKNVKIHFMDNSEAYNAHEFDFLVKYCTSEWIIMFTASDVLDKQLADNIMAKINDINFNHDILYVPYRRYVLGLESKHSPWYTGSHPAVFRKSSVRLNKFETHSALNFEGSKYHFKDDSLSSMYHLTHESVDGMTLRHMRYWRAEGMHYNQKSMKSAFKSILNSFYTIFIKRRTFLMGRDGIALACAYLSYFMMSYVYKWENKNNNATAKYLEIRDRINAEWLK